MCISVERTDDAWLIVHRAGYRQSHYEPPTAISSQTNADRSSGMLSHLSNDARSSSRRAPLPECCLPAVQCEHSGCHLSLLLAHHVHAAVLSDVGLMYEVARHIEPVTGSVRDAVIERRIVHAHLTAEDIVSISSAMGVGAVLSRRSIAPLEDVSEAYGRRDGEMDSRQRETSGLSKRLVQVGLPEGRGMADGEWRVAVGLLHSIRGRCAAAMDVCTAVCGSVTVMLQHSCHCGDIVQLGKAADRLEHLESSDGRRAGGDGQRGRRGRRGLERGRGRQRCLSRRHRGVPAAGMRS